MHPDLATRRRLLLMTYRRYLEADRTWNMAMREVKKWFPEGSQHSLLVIGDPGSRMRRLYDQRERAVLQLQSARLKLEVAKRRLEARRSSMQPPRVLLISLAEL